MFGGADGVHLWRTASLAFFAFTVGIVLWQGRRGRAVGRIVAGAAAGSAVALIAGPGPAGVPGRLDLAAARAADRVLDQRPAVRGCVAGPGAGAGLARFPPRSLRRRRQAAAGARRAARVRLRRRLPAGAAGARAPARLPAAGQHRQVLGRGPGHRLHLLCRAGVGADAAAASAARTTSRGRQPSAASTCGCSGRRAFRSTRFRAATPPRHWPRSSWLPMRPRT